MRAARITAPGTRIQAPEMKPRSQTTNTIPAAEAPQRPTLPTRSSTWSRRETSVCFAARRRSYSIRGEAWSSIPALYHSSRRILRRFRWPDGVEEGNLYQRS